MNSAEPAATIDTIDTAIADWFVEAAGLPPEPWQRLGGHDIIDAHVAATQLAMAFDRVHLGVTAVASEVRWGRPRRPERVSRMRRAYRAKRRGW